MQASQSLKEKTQNPRPKSLIKIWQKFDNFFYQTDKWNSNIFSHLSSVLISHYFTFLLCPLPMLPPNWLNSRPYGTRYSVIAQCNACTFYSLFVWLMILSKHKLKIYLKEIIKRRRALNYLFVYNKWLWERLCL